METKSVETVIPPGKDWIPWMFASEQRCATFTAKSRKTADGYAVVYTFDGQERLLTDEDVELSRDPKGPDGKSLGAIETLSITHPPGILALVEYHGTFTRHPEHSEDDTVEQWRAELELCDGKNHMMTYLGMPRIRSVTHAFKSANQMALARQAERARSAEKVRDILLAFLAGAALVAAAAGFYVLMR